MGLSKPSRFQETAAQKESAEVNPSLAFALKFQAEQSAPLCLWLDAMQKDLLKTAVALRDHPASVLYRFQKTLSRPSYFLASTSPAEWVVLLGPKTVRRPAVPRIQAQRIFRRILEEGSELQQRQAELKILHPAATSTDIDRQREACLALSRRAERTLRRMLRVQSGMSRRAPLYDRMLSLQAQRFRAITRVAAETAEALRNAERRQTSAAADLAPRVVPMAIVPVTPRRASAAARFLRAFHQWLMDPIIDTRERV
jgi:hypothetical protein